MLSDAGLQRWPEHESTPPEADCLLLYDSPDQLLCLAGTASDFQGLTALGLLSGFRRLLELSDHSGQPLLAISQLQLLGSHGLRTWLEGGDTVTPSPVSSLSIPPLLASVVLKILEAQPAILDCYYDLELRAVLFGRDPDWHYSERLQLAGQSTEALLQAFLASLRVEAAAPKLEHRLASLHTELREAREVAELSLLQAHQVKEELEHYFNAVDEKQRQLQIRDSELEDLRRSKSAQEIAHDQQLKGLRERLEPQLAELEQRLFSRDNELHEVRQVAELTLLQLHKVQEELGHYSSATAEKQQQLEARDREFEILRNLYEPRLAELEDCLASRGTELQDVREEAELTLLQLHNVQEELEHYFLKARSIDQLAQAQSEQVQRAQRLMLRLQSDVLPIAPDARSHSVQVWPEVVAAMTKPTLETEALLSTYAESLQRASALLERARGL